MPLDPEKVRLCREWLTIAASDLRAALTLKHASPPLLDHVLYHCQQCAEKTLKAFLVWYELRSQCRAVDPTLGTLNDDVIGLTAYGWMYRYPDRSEIEPTLKDAEDADRIASQTMTTILTRLPADVAP